MLIPFARWRPDVSNLNSTYSADVLNVLLSSTSYIPFPQLTPFSNAVPEQVVGGFTARNAAGQVEIFVGTAGKLYKFNSTTLGWDPVSRLAANQIVNGTFSADTDWTKNAGWTIAAGVATATAVATQLVISQAQTLTEGTVYKVVFTVSGFSAGGVRPIFSGGTPVLGTTRTANGTYTEYLTAVAGNTTFALQAINTTTLNVDNVTVQALANYGATVEERWRFAQFGNFVIAVNINDAPQVFEIGVSTEFADLAGSPPQARHISVWGGFVVLGGLSGNEDRVHWSGLEDHTQWTPGVNNCDFQDFPDGGDVQGMTSATNPFVFMQRAIWAGSFVPGSIQVFTFTKIHDKRGAYAPYAIASRGAATFFVEAGGVSQLNADGTISQIGLEKIDRTVFEQINGTDLFGVIGEVDPFYNRYYLAAKFNSTSDAFDRLIIYDWGIGEFTQIETETGILFPLSSGTVGYTLEGLDAISASLDDLGFSLDAKVWQGGAPVMAAIDASNQLGFFNGDAAEATIDSQEFGATDGMVTRITEIMPVIDTDSALITVMARMRRGDDFTSLPEVGQSTNTGIVRKRSRARYHKVRTRIPAGTVWSHAQGLNHNGVPAGNR